ncbi:phytanoyl-CoA dioxygenase family protein [Sphingomonas sp. MMS12-HWE2-04]|uniref:phytanoyl-CoA dioxygenase family protein n=1 Tax=Sphingomonas sp. MMS12-HWE2-04 TaxID=3234199 RepID=UPI00384ABD5B
MTQSAAMADATPSIDATGLYRLWQVHTRRVPIGTRRDMGDKILLDALGLGLEQTLTYLATDLPDYAAFLEWILAIAGRPDPLMLARYEATLAGWPLPAAVRDGLAAIDAMPPVLDADDLTYWDVHGFVILRGAITPSAAEAAAALVWKANGAHPDDPDSWYGAPRNQGIMVQLFQHPALEPARRSARVHKAFAQLWGTSNLWSTVDRVGFNPPEREHHAFRAPRLHWDVSLTRPIPFATQGVLYLTDTAEDQGALELVPGFHHRIDAWLNEIGDANAREVDLSAEATRVAAGAGDLVIWRQDLPHGASPNRARLPRLVQYVNLYSPDMMIQDVWR